MRAPKPNPDAVMATPEVRAMLTAAAARPAPTPACAECRRLRRALRAILAEVRELQAALTFPKARGGQHDDDAE